MRSMFLVAVPTAVSNHDRFFEAKSGVAAIDNIQRRRDTSRFANIRYPSILANVVPTNRPPPQQPRLQMRRNGRYFESGSEMSDSSATPFERTMAPFDRASSGTPFERTMDRTIEDGHYQARGEFLSNRLQQSPKSQMNNANNNFVLNDGMTDTDAYYAARDEQLEADVMNGRISLDEADIIEHRRNQAGDFSPPDRMPLPPPQRSPTKPKSPHNMMQQQESSDYDRPLIANNIDIQSELVRPDLMDGTASHAAFNARTLMQSPRDAEEQARMQEAMAQRAEILKQAQLPPKTQTFTVGTSGLMGRPGFFPVTQAAVQTMAMGKLLSPTMSKPVITAAVEAYEKPQFYQEQEERYKQQLIANRAKVPTMSIAEAALEETHVPYYDMMKDRYERQLRGEAPISLKKQGIFGFAKQKHHKKNKHITQALEDEGTPAFERDPERVTMVEPVVTQQHLEPQKPKPTNAKKPSEKQPAPAKVGDGFVDHISNPIPTNPDGREQLGKTITRPGTNKMNIELPEQVEEPEVIDVPEVEPRPAAPKRHLRALRATRKEYIDEAHRVIQQAEKQIENLSLRKAVAQKQTGQQQSQHKKHFHKPERLAVVQGQKVAKREPRIGFVDRMLNKMGLQRVAKPVEEVSLKRKESKPWFNFPVDREIIA
eukprot:gene1295-271_t